MQAAPTKLERMSPRRSKRPLAGRVLTGTGFSLVAVLLVRSGPIYGASTTSNGIHYAAPYVGAVPFAQSSSNGLPRSCAENVSARPSADPTDGRVVASAKDVCGGFGLHLAGLHLTAGWLGPSFIANSGGNRTISIRWSLHWSADITLHPGSTSAIGSFSLAVYGNLFDNTTGSWLLGGTSDQSTVVTVAHGNLSLHNSQGWGNVTIRFRAQLVRGQQYLFHTGMSERVHAQEGHPCYPLACHGTPAEASVSLNVGSGGHDATVVSIREMSKSSVRQTSGR
jgi:hypothetical protein